MGYKEIKAPTFIDSLYYTPERVKVLREGSIYLQNMFLVLITVWDWINSKTTEPPELDLLKNSKTLLGIEPMTLQTGGVES